MKNLFLNVLFATTLIFGMTNCVKEDKPRETKAVWTNCEGRWNGEEMNCSGDGCCCLAEVTIVAKKVRPVIDLTENGAGLEGIAKVQELLKDEEAADLFKALNDKQKELLASGDYIITPLILEPELYETKKQGRIKFFAAEKTILDNKDATLGDYDFNFGVDIREE